MKTTNKLVILFALFIGLTIILKLLDQTPPGIIPFEFAKTANTANNMVHQWENHDALPLKKWSFYIDYLYLIIYSTLLYLLLKRNGISTKMLLALPFVAALLDFIENTCLLPFLFHAGSDTMAQIAFYTASIKFGLIGVSILLILFMWLRKLANR